MAWYCVSHPESIHKETGMMDLDLNSSLQAIRQSVVYDLRIHLISNIQKSNPKFNFPR